MADAAGEETVAVILRLLPPDAAELILGRLPGEAAARLRARLTGPGPDDRETDVALAEFFDLLRIADRVVPTAEPEAAPVAEPVPPAGPLDELRQLPPDRLARALDGEPPAAVALILGSLGAAAAGQVMRRLPAALREDVAVRLTRPAVNNPALLDRLARAVAEKGRRLAEAPPVPTADERAATVADMLRALPRADRGPVLARLTTADADFAAAVSERLYRIEDLLRIPDRQLQGLLAELEVRKLATALHGVEPAVRDKVMANMSTRARGALAEEIELVRSASASVVKEARVELFATIRRLEEEGRIVIEE